MVVNCLLSQPRDLGDSFLREAQDMQTKDLDVGFRARYRSQICDVEIDGLPRSPHCPTDLNGGQAGIVLVCSTGGFACLAFVQLEWTYSDELVDTSFRERQWQWLLWLGSGGNPGDAGTTEARADPGALSLR